MGAALSGLLAQLQQLVPPEQQGLTPDQLLSRGLSSSGANPTLALLSTLEQPTLNELYFETELELDAHVELGEHVWAAIVFEEVPEEGALEQAWRYKLRFNASAVPSTKSRYDRYALGGYSGTHEAYRQSGLLSLQEAVDHAILRAAGDERGADFALTYALPYPRAGYTVNRFVGFLGSLLPLIITFSLVVPLFSVLGTLVSEKEQRLREQLLISGVAVSKYYASLLLVNGGNFVLIALLISIEMKFVLTRTTFSLLFVFLALFALAAMTFGVAFSPFFKNPRIASIVVGVGFFMTLFVKEGLISSSLDNYSPLLLFILSLLPPCAFALGAEHLTSTEAAGMGVGWGSASDPDNPYPVSTAMLMLLLDVFLYAALFAYLDQCWPSEFGIQKPWYFPCLPSTWRRAEAISYAPSPTSRTGGTSGGGGGGDNQRVSLRTKSLRALSSWSSRSLRISSTRRTPRSPRYPPTPGTEIGEIGAETGAQSSAGSGCAHVAPPVS